MTQLPPDFLAWFAGRVLAHRGSCRAAYREFLRDWASGANAPFWNNTFNKDGSVPPGCSYSNLVRVVRPLLRPAALQPSAFSL